MCCVRTIQQSSASLDYLSQAYQPVSPSILSHFRWELYQEEATAPTVSTEAVLLTAIINALENREVAVLDVPGAFMQVDSDELVHMRFTGEMVNILLHIDYDKYKDYVMTERDDKVMYMELLKALYSTLRAAPLF